ncbi:hypothetical protein LTR56_021289 [Elasticomyces elasticus]|nr:hypothetical protein LTR56_021289 [Elasticomyces elasticus]KAK3667942.1 hypothetical protein LTR22_001009 [Elasticomyces elasticus]KAK4925118.1 hypothetical protein LTR49_007891 [Elasticomyces elasticus]KAK5767582.1 hypothetical protein LTS12_002083 [Elasticomyces elasticus]
MQRIPGRSRSSLQARYRALEKSGHEPFTPAQDEQLCNLREKERLNWTQIAERMPAWSADDLCSRYCRNTPVSARANVMPPQMCKDSVVDKVRHMRENGYSNLQIANALEGEFTSKQVGDMHVSVTKGTLRERYKNGTATRRRFTEDEDARILDMRSKKRTWVEVAQIIGRSVGALRNHYLILQDRMQSSLDHHDGDAKRVKIIKNRGNLTLLRPPH